MVSTFYVRNTQKNIKKYVSCKLAAFQIMTHLTCFFGNWTPTHPLVTSLPLLAPGQVPLPGTGTCNIITLNLRNAFFRIIRHPPPHMRYVTLE